MNLAQDFFDRFAGLERVHGVTIVVPGEKTEQGKAKSKSWLEWEPYKAELWEKHLAGEQGLGVVPIRDDGTVRWGAIDVDVYNLDHIELNKKILDLRLPLILARSKSGGAHAFAFFKEDVSAQLVRDKLAEWANALGHPGVEIFPKQSNLSSTKDVGNWLNMPYSGGEKTLRYAFSKRSAALTPRTFIEYAATMAMTEAELKKAKPLSFGSEFWIGAPVCLNTLSATGFEVGSRNKSLFNIGIYLKLRFPGDWGKRLGEYNQKYMKPPLEEKEASTIHRALTKKDYSYTCKDDPLVNVCDRSKCIKCKFGVGLGPDDLGITLGAMLILELDPPIFIWTVNEKRIEFTAIELSTQGKFAIRIMEVIHFKPNSVRGDVWDDTINTAMAGAETQTPPEESTPAGQAWEALDGFCTGRAPARHRDEILNGKPWTEDGLTYFRIKDFIQYLKVQDIKGNTQQIYRWLRDRGCTNGGWVIKGKSFRWWAVPEFDKQTEESEVPRIPQGADF